MRSVDIGRVTRQIRRRALTVGRPLTWKQARAIAVRWAAGGVYPSRLGKAWWRDAS